MKRSKYSESQIVFAIQQIETGTARWVSVRPPFTIGRKNMAVWGVSELRRLKNVEEENSQLKKLFADLSLDKQILQDVLKKKF